MRGNYIVTKSPGSRGIRSIARHLKTCAIEILRQYHNLLTDFVESYGSSISKSGTVFKKESQFLHDLIRLIMPENILEIGLGRAASTVALAEAIRKNAKGCFISIDIDKH